MKNRKHQLHICNVRSDDLVRAKAILRAAEDKFKLVDKTEDSRVENTVKSLVDRKFYNDGMGARQVGNMVIFDFNQVTQNHERIDAIYVFVTAQLKNTFPIQSKCPERQDFVEARSTLPVTDEMKTRAVRLIKEKLRNKPNENT